MTEDPPEKLCCSSRSRPTMFRENVSSDIRVKTEPDEDIKDFAETTMNELLGWYGYDKVSSGEAQNLSLRALRHFVPPASSPPPRTSDSSPGTSRHDDASDGVTSEGEVSRDGAERRTPLLDADSDAHGSNNGMILCAWCLKNGLKLFTLKTASGETKAFCSEPCFNQCRRAAFKKNRICDWCKHVRHTVNYVDFQDGEHQLQFCSDKCLNQYKMNIFCKETQAYLQMHPHLQEAGNKANGSNSKSNLITPDLWLRDCKESVNGTQSTISVPSDDESYPSGTSATRCSSGELEDLSMQSRTSPHTNFKTDHHNILKQNIINNHLKEHKITNNLLLSSDKNKHAMNFKSLLNVTANGSEENFQERKKKHRSHDKYYMRKSERRAQNLSMTNSTTKIGQPAVAHSHLQQVGEHGMRSSLSPSVSYNPANGSPPSLNSSKPLPGSELSSLLGSGPPIPSNLPPPPPLLHGELMSSHFLPPPSHMYQQPSLNLLAQQQQLDMFLRVQSALGIRPNVSNVGRSAFPDPLVPLPAPHGINHQQSSSSSLVPPATMMVPYPLVIPLPVPIPIPIPIPLSSFLNKKTDNKNGTTSAEGENMKSENDKDQSVSQNINSQIHTVERVQSEAESAETKLGEEQNKTNTSNSTRICPVTSTQGVDDDDMTASNHDREKLIQVTKTRSKNKHSKQHVITNEQSKRQRLMDKHNS